MIRRIHYILLVQIMLAMLTGELVWGEDTTGKTAANSVQSKRKLIYNRPESSLDIGMRQDGVHRGKSMNNSNELIVLAPDHVGLTTYEYPQLYWYQSHGVNTPVEITINHPDQIEPIAEMKMGANGEQGIRKIDLGQAKIKINKGVEYEWFVTISNEQKNLEPSQDIVASGVIKRTDIPPVVAANLQRHNNEELVYILSEEGIWYDALECISKLIEQHPNEIRYRELRAELLDYGNLPMVAEYDRKREK